MRVTRAHESICHESLYLSCNGSLPGFTISRNACGPVLSAMDVVSFTIVLQPTAHFRDITNRSDFPLRASGNLGDALSQRNRLLPIANRTRRPLLPPVKFPIAKRQRHKHSRFFFFCISLFSSVFPLSFLFYLFIYFFFLFVSREKAKFQTLFSFHIATIANPTEISILLCVADSETQPLWYFLRASVNVARVQWRVHGSREQLFRVCWKSDRNLRPATRVTVTSRMYSVISCLVNSCLDVAVLHASYLVASLNVTSESVSCWLGD